MIESNLTDEAEIKALLVISDDRVTEMLTTIKPLVPKENLAGEVSLYEIEIPDDIRRTAFRWAPKFIGPTDMSRMHLLETFTTYHTCGYHGVFKPDIAEVLAQIDRLPDEIKWQVVAFDVLVDVDILTESFYGHKAKTVLYRAADNCSSCHGARGGVAGNGNIVDSKVLCDYCSCAAMPIRKR